MSEHPNNWQKRSFAEVCHILAGYGFPERLQGKPQGDLPFFKVGDISESWKRGQVHLAKANHYISYDEALAIRARPLPAKTTVFAKIGAAIALNRRAILSEPSLVDNNVMGVYPLTDALDHKFLYHFVCTLKLDELSRATTVPSIRKTDVEQIRIPLPTLDEQLRIVSEIEKQFTRLEAGVATLKRVQVNLKRYRAAVLKAACEGRLVPIEADLARKDGRPYETGEQLLARILTERRRKWQGRGKYKEPAAPNTANLPPVPKGWTWSTLEQLNLANRPCAYGVLQPGDDIVNGVPFVRVGDIKNGKVDTDNLKRISETIANQYPRTKLQGGELAMTLVGAIGRTAIIPESLAGGNTARAVGIVPLSKSAKASWVEIWFRNPAKMAQMDSKSHEVARKTLNLEDVRAATVALPPLAEQERIAAEVERRLSVIEEQDAVVSASLQRATRLRQSILQRAFSGKLLS